MYIPKVSMRSSQQLSSLTAIDQVCPVLSRAVAEVAVVIMERGRRGDSMGGSRCDMFASGLVGGYECNAWEGEKMGARKARG